jgi:drug/metabolite transporter (DMT)-like permease
VVSPAKVVAWNGRNSEGAQPSRIALLLAFFAIYVVWGSTYLAIRYAVESIPPLVVAGVRHSTAGLALFAWALARGYRPTWKQWRASVILGTLYFTIGHGSLHWAETIVPSGMAALLVGTEPIWIALMAATVSRDERLTGKTVFGLLLGMAGVALLMRDGTGGDHRRLVIGSIAILLGALSWAVGVIYSRSQSLPKDPVARAGMASMAGAALLLVSSLVSGEMGRTHIASISARSVWALLYLIVFGSIVAFTAYTWLLDHCSPTLVSTHTYANPIIAVLLGWALAGEVLDTHVLLAALLTLASVFLINRGTAKKPAESGAMRKAA